MRIAYLTSFLLAGVATAHAGAIDTITTGGEPDSIQAVTCKGCPPLKDSIKAKQAALELKPGTQRIEYKKVHGEMKAYRTEAWFGGSPVVFVNKASDFLPEGSDVAAVIKVQDQGTASLNPPNVIDTTTTTSAVSADLDGDANPAALKPVAAKFDPAAMQLRLK
jgi:hypothetical protein